MFDAQIGGKKFPHWVGEIPRGAGRQRRFSPKPGRLPVGMCIALKVFEANADGAGVPSAS